MTVQRYDFGTEYRGNTGVPGIVGKIGGRYVRHDDYAAAVAHNEYLLARLRKSDDQLAAIEADRQQRGEPVAWQYFDGKHWTTTIDPDGHAGAGRKIRPLYAAPQPAAPAQEPSDGEIMSLAYDIGAMPEQMTDGSLLRFARALLARYGHPVVPEGWQLVPKEPTQEMFYTCEHIFDHGNSGESPFEFFDRKYKDILEAAPKFGAEEMTTETILTDKQISDFWQDSHHYFARAIEQAVLQSPEVQALRRDAERYRWLRRGAVENVAVAQGLYAMDYGSSAVVSTYSEELVAEELDEVIDASIRSGHD